MLRERVLDEARLRFSEGVITSDDFVDRETDLLSARLTRAAHRVELAQACFDFLPARALLDLAGWAEVDLFAHS